MVVSTCATPLMASETMSLPPNRRNHRTNLHVVAVTEQILEHLLILLGILSVAATRPLPANVRDDVARREWEKGQALLKERLKLRKEERIARRRQRKSERLANQ